MKVREKLMRKVMAVVIAAATIFSISGGTKVVPVKAAGEVAEVIDDTGMRIAGYTTFEEAARNVYNNYTIKMLADATESCSVDIGNKNLTIDLNGKNLTITQIPTMNALTIKNGSMSAEINNANSGNLGTLVVDNVKLNTTFFQWMPDDGVVLESGTTVTVSNPTSAQCVFEKLTMQESCVFKVGTNAYISNYEHIANGLDVKEFLPEGYSFNANGTRILDQQGNNASNYVLRYRRLSDSQLTVTLNPDTYVYDGNEKKTCRDSNL